MEDETPIQPGERTAARAAWIFGVALLVVAVVVVGLFFFAGQGDPACDGWEEAKSEWVETFPPIQRQINADLADFQGWVEIDGQRVDRPEGC